MTSASNSSFDTPESDIANTLVNYLAAIEAGTIDIKTLQKDGLTLDAGSFTGFRRDTYRLIDRLTRQGISVRIRFFYKGIRYVITIPAGTPVNTELLCNEEGYCGFLNLLNYFDDTQAPVA